MQPLLSKNQYYFPGINLQFNYLFTRVWSSMKSKVCLQHPLTQSSLPGSDIRKERIDFVFPKIK